MSVLLVLLYVGAIATDISLFGRGQDLIFLDELQCTGLESMLLDCPSRDPGLHNCFHSEDVGVICQLLSERCHFVVLNSIRDWSERQGFVVATYVANLSHCMVNAFDS